MNVPETLRGIATLLATLPRSDSEYRALVARAVARAVADAMPKAEALGAGYAFTAEGAAEVRRALAHLLATIERAPVAYAPGERDAFLALVRAETPSDHGAVGFVAGLL